MSSLSRASYSRSRRAPATQRNDNDTRSSLPKKDQKVSHQVSRSWTAVSAFLIEKTYCHHYRRLSAHSAASIYLLYQYLEELRQNNAEIKPDFTDQSFTVVGSLTTLDASFTFTVGVENVNVIRSNSVAGFSAKQNPTNDKGHTGVQRLNAARNIIWLLKEKLKGPF